MAVISYPKMNANQRFDLEDYNLGLSAQRTDSHLYTQRFLAPTSYILQGFTISQTYIGQSTAQLVLTNATLINGDNSGDVSWWTAPAGAAPINLTIGVGGLRQGRNYVELVVGATDGTPLQRAFWDPSANSGQGQEFTQNVNTVTSLNVSAVINQTGWTGGNNIRCYIIDVDAFPSIKGIHDKRNLLFRLGTSDNASSGFTWGTRSEPTVTLTFNSNSAQAYVSGETVSFTSGATATVAVGGTNNVQVYGFSADTFQLGDTVTGLSSSGSGTLLSYFDTANGTGADKDIHSYRDMYAALMNEIRQVKGTPYWYQIGSVASLATLLNFVNTILTPVSAGAKLSWSGTALSVTDDKSSGQTSADVVAALRIPGYADALTLCRQDGTGGSATLTIPDGSLVYVTMPARGNDAAYSGQGSGATNYQIVARSAFVPSDSNYILAYREGSNVVIPKLGELKPNEIVHIGSGTSNETLAYIGAADETTADPTYSATPSASLPGQFPSPASLTTAVGINTENINSVASGVTQPYAEYLAVVASGASGTNQVNGPVTAGSTVTLPNDSRNGNVAKSYKVGQGSMSVLLNGIAIERGVDWLEVGTAGSLATTITTEVDLLVGDIVEFRILNPQAFS